MKSPFGLQSVYICFPSADAQEWRSSARLLDPDLVLQLKTLGGKKTTLYCTCKVHSFDMEILEVIKFHNAIFTVTFYSKIILSNAHTWQHTVHFQIGTCEECVQILLHINRIDLGDILNISTTVASLNVEMKKGKMSKTLSTLLQWQ